MALWIAERRRRTLAESVEGFELRADARMALFVSLDGQGRQSPVGPGDLHAESARWARTASTPSGPASLLKTSRDLYVHGYFVYEFLLVADLVALQAVEAALRVRVVDSESSGREPRLADLITRAAELGIVSEQEKELLHSGRQLRNTMSHPKQQAVWTPGMAAEVLAGAHQAVANMFPDEVVG